MRRIEFIAPVEAMRGNLSGEQALQYPTQDNKAWDAPADKRSYARNYKPRYVGAKRSRDGHVYFAVKTRSAVTMSTAMKHQMAVLSAGSVAANIIMTDMSTLPALQTAYLASAEYAQGWSFKRWVSYYTRQAFKSKIHITLPTTGGAAPVFYKNPYLETDAPSTAHDLTNYPQSLLVKFWLELSIAGVTFEIDGQTGIAFHATDGLRDIIRAFPPYTGINVLGLISIGESNNVAKDGSTAESGYYLYGTVTSGPITDSQYTIAELTANNNRLYWQYYTA